MRQYQRYCPCSTGTAGLAACMAWVASEPQDSTEFTSTPSSTVESSKFYHFIKLGFFFTNKHIVELWVCVCTTTHRSVFFSAITTPQQLLFPGFCPLQHTIPIHEKLIPNKFKICCIPVFQHYSKHLTPINPVAESQLPSFT